MAVDRFGLPLDDDEQIQQMTNVFTIPTSFEKCMTIEEQLLYLELTKQDRLVAGENVTLTRNDDHTVTISVNSVGKTYRIAEVTPDEGYVAAYALVEIETGVISGSKIQIPEPGTGVTPVITATASVDSATGTPSVQVVKTGTDEAPNFAFNFHNLRGQAGQNGQNGSDGAPGFSPSANIQQTATGAVVTITDEFGTTQAEISNGVDGAPGQSGADGVSPTASVAAITGGARITITDANGTTTQDIMDGSDGSDGDDGVGISSIAFKETDASGNNVYTITLTNSNTYDFTANRGPQGLQGPQGIPGSGADGVGISNITFDHEDASGNYVYLVTLSNNQTYTFTAPRGPQGVQGVQGVQGNPGQSGAPGNDGVSPVANVQSITGGARITITDANGTTTADVMDGAAGQNGQNGAPGYSPTASIQQTANGATITITDENGTTTATITNGQSGSNGVGISGITFKETDANGNNVYTVTLTDSSTYDITCPKGAAGTNGISPSASVAAITGGARITITDANGTTTQDIMDGATGQTGPAGPGVPSGGTDGQLLVKDGSTDYATRWENPSGGGGLTAVRIELNPFSYNNTLYNFDGSLENTMALSGGGDYTFNLKFNIVFLFDGSVSVNNFKGAFMEKIGLSGSGMSEYYYPYWGQMKTTSAIGDVWANYGFITSGAIRNTAPGTSTEREICFKCLKDKHISFKGSGECRQYEGNGSYAIPLVWSLRMQDYGWTYPGLVLTIRPIFTAAFGQSTGVFFKLY